LKEKTVRLKSLKLFLILAVLMGIVGVTQVFADCQGSPTEGSDTIVCDTNPEPALGFLTNGVGGGGGDDTIIVEEGTVIASAVGGDTIPTTTSMPLSTNPGNDTIIINGDVQGVYGNGGDDTIIIGETGSIYTWADGVYGDSSFNTTVGGNDTIIIEGVVNGTVEGGAGNDLIEISGAVNQGAYGGSGDDTIILEDGAGGTDGYSLYMGGNTGDDTLVFQMTITNQSVYDALSNLIASNVSSGTITINGQTYYWSDFEHLINMLVLILGEEAGIVFSDGRLNNDPAQTAVLYCDQVDTGVYALSPQGAPLFEVTQQQIDSTVAAATANGENQMLAGAEGQSFWALTSNEVLLHADAGGYDFVVPADICVPTT
jgi:hypothetical protein